MEGKFQVPEKDKDRPATFDFDVSGGLGDQVW
jgi:hypothetical protein